MNSTRCPTSVASRFQFLNSELPLRYFRAERRVKIIPAQPVNAGYNCEKSGEDDIGENKGGHAAFAFSACSPNSTLATLTGQRENSSKYF